MKSKRNSVVKIFKKKYLHFTPENEIEVKLVVIICVLWGLVVLIIGTFTAYNLHQQKFTIDGLSSRFKSESSNVPEGDKSSNLHRLESIYTYLLNSASFTSSFQQYLSVDSKKSEKRSTHVVMLMLSTEINELLCYSLVSSLFTDIPMLVIGYNMTPYTHLKKPFIYLNAIDQLKLNDDDVILNIDADVIFTGEPLEPFITDFVTHSPRSLEELNATAVRIGAMKAPSIFFGEKQCVGNQWYKNEQECSEWYDNVELPHIHYFEKMRSLYRSEINNKDINDIKEVNHEEQKYALESDTPFGNDKVYTPGTNEMSSKFRFINAGIGLHRVWAYRKLMNSLQRLMDETVPKEGFYWDDDQALMHILYGSLLQDEVEYNILNKGFNNKMKLRYEMYAGMLDVDQSASMIAVITEIGNEFYKLQYSNWLPHNVSSESLSFPNDVYGSDLRDIITRLFYMSETKNLFRETRIKHVVPEIQKNTYSIKHALPLLTIKNTESNVSKEIPNVFPRVLHFAGPGMKTTRITRAFNYLPWFVALRFDDKGRQGALSFLANARTHFLLNSTYEVYNYKDICPHAVKHIYNEAYFDQMLNVLSKRSEKFVR